ncbi:MAG TPA: hypothetical protein VKA36_04930 [Solirubrobacterales bacterium]|nr:hypothetical protein [Solirubrobacterales bacterium]
MDFEPKLLLIPVIAGVIGYGTNWVAVKMLFFPVHFHGFRIPGLSILNSYLPRRIRAVPGVAHGGIGWQGIIPSRAAKMGSISVDKGIAKLGSPSEFYGKLEPDKIAEHIVATSGDEIWELVESILQREHPNLWADLPPQIRQAVRTRMEAELPALVKEITDDIGNNIDHLLDIKLMVIRRIEARPELANRIFLEVGQKEMNFIVNSGLIFGFLLGLPQIPLFAAFDQWWILPIGGVVVGYLTNAIALRVIFQPVHPQRVGPFTVQGLFLRRQREVAGVYSRIIAEDVVNLKNIGNELMHGRQSDRTKRMIADRMRPAIDRAVGIARPAVRIAVGTKEYDAIRDSLAAEAVGHTMAPLSDPEFNRSQSDAVRALLEERMETMDPEDFSEMLRTAVVEDEWMLIMLGAMLGFLAGVLQIAFVF